MEIKLNQEEEVLLFTEEHWVVFLKILSLYLIGVFLSVFLLWMGASFYPQAELLGLGLFFLGYFTLLVTHHWAFIYIFSARLSGWAVTDKRIIDFNFMPYVCHDMTYLSIKDVNEIEKHQRGLIKNFFHYGEVEINVTSGQKPILFKYVPYPGRFVNLVSNLQKDAEKI